MAAYDGRRIRSAGLRMFSRSCSGRIVGISGPLTTLMLELGHESLATTQRYLADVRKRGEAKKAVADPDFVPKESRFRPPSFSHSGPYRFA
jgi:hypothetical protein